MSNEELVACTHCGRRNWHENVNCSWCNHKLVRPPGRTINRLMILVVVASLVSCAYVLVRL